MPKMTIRVILKSGSEFAIKCDKFTIKQNGFGQATGYNIEGITENKPVYLDFEQVAAVVRLFSDEHTEDTPKTEKKRGFTEKKTKCPHCGAHLDNGETCDCQKDADENKSGEERSANNDRN